jgi:hypothetical protein
VGTIGTFRRVAVAGLIAGSVTAVSSTAQAATQTQTQAMRGARHMFSRSLPAALRTTLLPQTQAPVAPGTFIDLFTRPMPLKVNGLVYQMEMGAFTVTDQFGSPPALEVGLSRLSTANGRITGEQDHVYGFSSTDMTMTAAPGLANIHIDTHRSFKPSKVDTTFTPSTAKSVRCNLFFGGRGTLTEASGSLVSRTFRIHTGTSPFFGTIATGPTQAVALADPGCISGGGVIVTGSSGGERFYFPCAGRETIQAGQPFADTQWTADLGFGGRNAYVYAQTGSSSVTESLGHLAIAVESGADMPAPEHSARGATATFSTAGNPLFSGSALFFSHQAPIVSRVRACAYEGSVRHYVATRYVGGMIPVAGSPLAALFDTGTFGFRGQSASLTLRRYLS